MAKVGVIELLRILGLDEALIVHHARERTVAARVREELVVGFVARRPEDARVRRADGDAVLRDGSAGLVGVGHILGVVDRDAVLVGARLDKGTRAGHARQALGAACDDLDGFVREENLDVKRELAPDNTAAHDGDGGGVLDALALEGEALLARGDRGALSRRKQQRPRVRRVLQAPLSRQRPMRP